MVVLTVPLLALVLCCLTGLRFGEGGLMYEEECFSERTVGVLEGTGSVSVAMMRKMVCKPDDTVLV